MMARESAQRRGSDAQDAVAPMPAPKRRFEYPANAQHSTLNVVGLSIVPIELSIALSIVAMKINPFKSTLSIVTMVSMAVTPRMHDTHSRPHLPARATRTHARDMPWSPWTPWSALIMHMFFITEPWTTHSLAMVTMDSIKIHRVLNKKVLTQTKKQIES